MLFEDGVGVGYKVAACVLLIAFGIFFPALILTVLRTRVGTNLNALWLRKYIYRHILLGGWPRDVRFADDELEALNRSWKMKNVEDPETRYWYVERRTPRFFGVWVSDSNFRYRFGDIFTSYRGQYYAFYFWYVFVALQFSEC